MKSPYKIYELTRIYKGKKQSYYQYTINPESGIPIWICKDHQRKTVKARSKADANQKIFYLIQDLKGASPLSIKNLPFGEYSKDFYLDGVCPLQRAAKSEGRIMKSSYLKEYRL